VSLEGHLPYKLDNRRTDVTNP